MKKIMLLLGVGLFCTGVFGQKTIRGTVRDGSDDLNTLPGVSIQVKGTTRGTVTDVNGTYSLPVQSGDKELVFSFIGMQTQTVAIKDRTVIDVVMEENSHLLGEVVISALNIKRDAKALSVAQQRVDATTIAEVRDQNIVSSLSGKISGVQVVPPGSSTGSARIVIRGNSSFSGNNQPLFVVDGMPIDNNDGSRDVQKHGGLDFGNAASDINPDDIETIDVLKGPNAAALYGSRAANGVVIITTKKASEGRFKVSVNSNTMFSYISQFPDFQNSFGVGHVQRMAGNSGSWRDWLVTEDEAGNAYPYPGIIDIRQGYEYLRSAGGPMLGQLYIGLDGKVHTYSPHPDNIYDFYNTAHVLTNNAAIEGGNKDNNYRVSFTNVTANDVVEKQNLVNKNTLTLRYFNTLVKNLTLDSKATYVYDNTKNRRYMNGDSYNPLYMYVFMPRSLTLDQLKTYKDNDGREVGNMGEAHNPYWSINETHNEDTKSRVMANFDLSYQIIDGLHASLKYGKDYIYTQRNEFKNKGAHGDDKGYYREAVNMINNSMYEFLFLLDKQFGDFSVVSTFGGSRLDYYSYDTWADIQTLKEPGFAHISNSNESPRTDENTYRKRINSLYGSASLGYKGWIYADVTGRNDWSSTLNDPFFYPSVGFSWVPSEMLKIPTSVFFGKIRGSFARVGNDTDPYRLIPYYNLPTDNIYNNYRYASLPGVLPNPRLKPETTTSYELGADLRFFNGRLNLDLTYYNSESTNQIVNAQMMPSSGYREKTYNAGSISNKGVELSVRGIPVETKSFDWEIMANFTQNDSKVTSMVDGLPRITLREVWNSYSVVQEGYPYGALFGRVWKTDPQGRQLVDVKGEAVVEDDHYMGNANPDWLLGISNRFRYKNFDVYVLLDLKKGGKIFSGSRKKGIDAGVFAGNEADRADFWWRDVIMGDGGDNMWGGTYFDNIYYDYDLDILNPESDKYDPTFVPEKCDKYFSPQDINYYANRFDGMILYDASYVKLREISVGYNFPKQWLSKIKMTNARISLVGRNLWILHQNTPKGLDPEAALYAGNGQGLEHGSIPPTTTLGFDIKISF
jgi:TonB-linked SusC/RagA family outer membrane protein